MFLEKVYAKMPIWVQEIMISGYGLKTYLERYSGNYKKYKAEYLKKKYENYELEEKNQVLELKRLLIYAKKNSSYYKEKLKEINVENIKSLEDLKQLPILEKEELRKNIDNIITTHEVKNNTGGTTGKAMTVYFTKDDFHKRMAYLDAFKERHGVKLGMKSARFSGKNLIPEKDKNKNKYWRTNKILNQRVYSTFHITDKTLKYYVENLNEYKPLVIDGFIFCIYEVAKYIELQGIELTFQPIVIFVTSETVLEHQREVVERVFKCKVRNQYASSEGAPFVTECIDGKLHYNMDTGIIEENGGDILLTSFTSYGTPLIRYRIGDRMIFSKEKCSCGSCHPVIERIEGRNTDYLYSEERGKINSVNISNAVKYIPNAVKNIQFIQNEKDEIIINIAIDKERYLDKYDDEIIKEMKNRFGMKMKFVINKLDEIPKEKSGKYRYIKNNLKI